MDKTKIDIEVENEISNGRIWRAKELLKHEISTSEFDQSLYKQYADVLSLMHDDLNAGCYYFLSTDRSPEAQRKIDLFVKRWKAQKIGSLSSHFPKHAKFPKKSDYPEPMCSDLVAMKLLDQDQSEGVSYAGGTDEDGDNGCFGWAFVFWSIVGVFGLGLVSLVGLIAYLVRWAFT